MNTIKFFAAVIATALFSLSANAEPVKKSNSSEVPAAVEIAKSNSRSMVQTTENGASYKYDYILDGEGRIVNRIISSWNSEKAEWTPLAAYSVVYTDAETILSYAKYNRLTKTYSKNVQQTRYNAADYPYVFTLPECCK